jgi:hypothetical protein
MPPSGVVPARSVTLTGNSLIRSIKYKDTYRKIQHYICQINNEALKRD